MRYRALCCVVVGVVMAIAGCSRQEATACVTDARYSTARSAPPVQIPDDLSPPNESDALRLPPDAVASASAGTGPCLQSPPSFFGENRPFQRDADAAERAPEPAAPSAPPAAGGDRVIDN
jgi:hypothetical protein